MINWIKKNSVSTNDPGEKFVIPRQCVRKRRKKKTGKKWDCRQHNPSAWTLHDVRFSTSFPSRVEKEKNNVNALFAKVGESLFFSVSLALFFSPLLLSDDESYNSRVDWVAFFHILQISYSLTASMIVSSCFLLILVSLTDAQSILFLWLINDHSIVLHSVFQLLHLSTRVVRKTAERVTTVCPSDRDWLPKSASVSRVFIDQVCRRGKWSSSIRWTCALRENNCF